MKLQLSIGMADNPRTHPIIEGKVKADGIDLICTPLHASELFWRQLRFGDFDVSEMSVSGLMMAVAGGDRMLVSLFEAMAPALQRSFFLSRRGRLLRGNTSEHTIAMHQRIFDRVRAGDAAGAETAMRAHLADSLRDMRAAYGGEPQAI